jgi:hypothetical protein
LNYELGDETHRRVRIAAAIEGITIKEAVERALAQWAADVIKREAGKL